MDGGAGGGRGAASAVNPLIQPGQYGAMGWSSSTDDQPGMADEAQSAPLRFPRDIRRVKMSTGAFGFVLAICGVILGPILFGWALGMAYTGGRGPNRCSRSRPLP